MSVKARLCWVEITKNARMSVASEPGSSRGVQEPMTQPPSRNEESTDNKLSEDILQLERTDLAEGAVTCQVCGAVIREGGRVTVSAFRSEPDQEFEIGDTCCRGHADEYERSWDGSLRELVVRGRVGTVSDVATQSSWPVLLEPELVAVSPVGTVEAYVVADTGPVSGADDADGEDERVDMTRSVAGQESAGRVRPASWCDFVGGGRNDGDR